MLALARTAQSRRIKRIQEKIQFQRAEMRAFKAENRVALNKARKAEREAEPEVGAKMKAKRLAAQEKRLVQFEKNRLRNLKKKK